jgi:hypothetical protein
MYRDSSAYSDSIGGAIHPFNASFLPQIAQISTDFKLSSVGFYVKIDGFDILLICEICEICGMFLFFNTLIGMNSFQLGITIFSIIH